MTDATKGGELLRRACDQGTLRKQTPMANATREAEPTTWAGRVPLPKPGRYADGPSLVSPVLEKIKKDSPGALRKAEAFFIACNAPTSHERS